MTAPLNIEEAKAIAFGPKGSHGGQRQVIVHTMNPEISGKFHNNREQMFELLGIDAPVAEQGKKNYSQAAYAQSKLENGVMRAAKFSQWISNAQPAEFLAELKARRNIEMPPHLNADQQTAWIKQAKVDWKNAYLDSVTADCEANTKSQVGTGNKSPWAVVGGMLFAGWALKGKVMNDDGTVKKFGLGTLLRLGLFGLIGFKVTKFMGEQAGGILGGIASKFGDAGKGFLGSILGEKTIEKASDVVTGRGTNRTKLRAGLQMAMENAVGADPEIIAGAEPITPTNNVNQSQTTPSTLVTEPDTNTPAVNNPATSTAPAAPVTNTVNANHHQPNTPVQQITSTDPVEVMEARLTTDSQIDNLSPQAQIEFQIRALQCFCDNYGSNGQPITDANALKAIKDRIAELKAKVGADVTLTLIPAMTPAEFNVISMHDADTIIGGVDSPLQQVMMARATTDAHIRLTKAREAKAQKQQQNRAANFTSNIDTSQIREMGDRTVAADAQAFVAILAAMPSVDAMVEIAAGHPNTRDAVLAEIEKRQASNNTNLRNDDTLTPEKAIEAIKAMPEGEKAEFKRESKAAINDNALTSQNVPNLLTNTYTVTIA